MTTPQTIGTVAPRSRIRPATVMTAFGILVAITVSVLILALTGASHTTTATPLTPSQAASGSVPQLHYLGPRQDRAALKPQTDQGQGYATTPGAGASNRAPEYMCVAEKFCVRVR